MTEPSARPRRQPAERTGPRRQPTGVFRRSSGPPPPRPAPDRAADTPSEAPRSGFDSAIDTAYRLCQEYVDLGREAAQSHTHPPEDPMQQNSPSDMTMLWFRLWMDTMRMWSGYAQPFMPGFPGMPAADPTQRDWDQGGPAPAPPHGRPSAASGTDVTVQVSSLQPTAVTVALSGQADASTLGILPLHAMDAPGAPPLSTIELDLAGARLRVRVAVPKDQPPGTYVGAIFNKATKTPCGTLTVCVGDDGP